MAFSGGVFSRLYNWVTDAAGAVPITATRVEAELNGFATGLSSILTRDGQSLPSAAIPFNGNKITGLANATADTDMLNRITADGRYNKNGNCYLQYASATSVLLTPLDGNKLTIAGQRQVIPAAGVSLTLSGTAAWTNYYVYAYMNSGTMTLELSTTGPAADTTTGIVIKSGDSSRTLVGLLNTQATPNQMGPAVTEGVNNISVISWFNRRKRRVYGNNIGVATGSTSYIALGAACIVQNWASEAVDYQQQGMAFNNTSNRIIYVAPFVDGSQQTYGVQNYTQGANWWYNQSFSEVLVVAEGAHTYHTYGAVSGGTATYYVIFSIEIWG